MKTDFQQEVEALLILYLQFHLVQNHSGYEILYLRIFIPPGFSISNEIV